MKPARALIALAALPLIAACSGSHPKPAAGPHTAPAAATTIPASPAGCDQATLVLAAVREQMKNGQAGAAFRQLRDLGKTVPDGQLKLDADAAALALSRFRVDAALGRPVRADVKMAVASLAKITRYCAG